MAIENAHRSSVSLKLNAGSRPATGTMIVKKAMDYRGWNDEGNTRH